MKKPNKLFSITLFLLSVVLIITACQPSTGTPTPVSTLPPNTPLPTNLPEPTPTTAPLKSLTICTAALPESLLPYHAAGLGGKANILNLIYEAPFIAVDGELDPVILESVPDRENGDLVMVPVSVQAGQPVVDATGQLTVLKAGLVVRPAGCRSGDCVKAWDGETPLEMDQMLVNYRLRENLTWSDGTPVRSGDSVFSFDIARDAADLESKWVYDRTQSYTVVDQRTVQWMGLPGFSNADLARFFWKPMPAHLYQDGMDWENMLQDDRINTSPIGYGPFIVSEWEDGLLRLTRNPDYFRSDEGLPKLDQIVFRQLGPGAPQAWEALLAGQCDVLDSSFIWAEAQDVIREARLLGDFELIVDLDKSWTQLVFGIQPADYDDFYNPQLDGRPDILGDARTRQAFMYCLDRESMYEDFFGDLGQVWQTYLPPQDSQLGAEREIAYDPKQGAELLAEVGWFDHDGDPSTPLQAWNVAGVPAGTSLAPELLVSPYGFHQEIAQTIQSDLSACGVGVTVTTQDLESLYAPGPEGALFGRRFDLALISWQPMPGGDCQLYQSWAVPRDENYWIGTNIAGLLNEAYDTACGAAVLALPDELEGAVGYSEEMFLSALPAVPLFSTPKAMVIPADSCYENEISTEGDFFANLAYFRDCP
jgi:peptide/nickel transport system substrate-binding protein